MFDLTEERRAIRDGVAAICRRFGDDYWAACEKEERFPREFHQAMAEGGWLGITMPERHGGAGLGVTEAAIVMHTIACHGGAMAAASSIHINMFGPHAMVVHGSSEQQARWIPPLVKGEGSGLFRCDRARRGIGHDEHHPTFATKVEGGYRVTGRKMWTSTAQVGKQDSHSCSYRSEVRVR